MIPFFTLRKEVKKGRHYSERFQNSTSLTSLLSTYTTGRLYMNCYFRSLDCTKLGWMNTLECNPLLKASSIQSKLPTDTTFVAYGLYKLAVDSKS